METPLVQNLLKSYAADKKCYCFNYMIASNIAIYYLILYKLIPNDIKYFKILTLFEKKFSYQLYIIRIMKINFLKEKKKDYT